MSLRDNDLLDLPREIGEMVRLRELHIQNNRLTVLPPEICKTQTGLLIVNFGFIKETYFAANVELRGNKSVLKMEENPWVTPIAEQYLLGISHVLDYIETEAYRM